MTRNAPALIGLSVLVAAACYLVAMQGIAMPDATSDPVTRLATAVSLMIVICGAALLGQRREVSPVLRQAVAWSGLTMMALVVFVYRAELHDVGGPLIANLIPVGMAESTHRQATAEDASADQAVVTAGRGGHFYVEAMINGTHVQFVADTGATLVALTAEDATRIGFDTDELDFRHRYRSASGYANAAHVTLDEVSVGPVVLRDVRASVSEPGVLGQNLLGMSFLSGLSSFHIRGDQLVLRQ